MKKYLKTYTALAATFLLLQQGATQSTGNWRNGYFISQSYDTVHGQIDYKNWNHSPGAIQFRKGDSIMSLKAANTRLLQIEGYDTYIGYKGKRMITTTSASSAINDKVDSVAQFSSEPVFLRRLIVTDKASILLYSSPVRQNFFIAVPGQPLEELIYRTYVLNDRVVEDQVYRQQLQALFAQEIMDKNLGRDLEVIRYEEADLEQFINKLSGLKKVKKTKPYRSQFGVIAGVSQNNYHISTSDAIGPWQEHSYAAAYSPIVGLQFTFFRQRNFGRYFLTTQARFWSYELTGENYQLRSTVRSGLIGNVNLFPGLNIINTGNIKWNVAAGLSVLYLGNNGEDEQMIGSEYVSKTNHRKPFIYNGGVQTSVVVDKRLLVWLQYSLPVSVTSYIYYSGVYTSLSAGVGWNFIR